LLFLAAQSGTHSARTLSDGMRAGGVLMSDG
jgi:hypothetical protein